MSNGTSSALNSEQDLASMPTAQGDLCHRYTTGLRHSEAISGRKDYFCGDTIASKLLA